MEIPNDSIPLNCLAEGVFYGTNKRCNDYHFHSTSLGWANHHGARRIFEVLEPHAGVHDSVQFSLLDRLMGLLDRDPGLANARDELGHAPLHCLNTEHPRVLDILELLLANGADPTVRDHSGETPYDRLVLAGRHEVPERLGHRSAADSTA